MKKEQLERATEIDKKLKDLRDLQQRINRSDDSIRLSSDILIPRDILDPTFCLTLIYTNIDKKIKKLEKEFEAL